MPKVARRGEPAPNGSRDHPWRQKALMSRGELTKEERDELATLKGGEFNRNRQKNPILPGLRECVIYEYRYTTKGLE